jgi:flagellar biosynthesis/type III secretory pathway chaperone
MDTQLWEREISALLNELSSTQTELLSLLDDKRRLLVAADTAGLQALADRESAVVVRLQSCQDHRARLLARAAEERLPADSIRSLAKAMSPTGRKELSDRVEEAANRFRLLGHHSLSNWVLIQRSLLHLSQLIEIIATGGRRRPTYGKGEPAHAGGSLVDQAA